ncbi:hypothetical protein [Siccirubricoccus phaeus]|uniref:hypothetical protein n=1 Tax=Siccirubricoccus phaeus TaxID=2595053 RepID=UPI0011F10903|nr:hypothetical protein [Siccirubricoccus phaeus]
MAERRVGFTVSGDKVVVVDAEVPVDGPIVLIADHTWSLQKGAREDAYNVIYQQVANYLREHGVKRVVLKASAVNQRGSMKLAHLESAEVRGVVIAAARSVCPVRSVAKAIISRQFGDRTVDEYVKDDVFWTENTEGVDLRAGSREAALLLIADRGTA